MSHDKADLGYLRGYNEALVVAHARTTPTFDRAAIAAATGLTPQAVSKVIGRLSESGMVESEGVRRGAVGKPTRLYRLVPASRYAIGAHVTRRALRVVLTDLLGTVVDSTLRSLPGDFTPDQLLAALSEAVQAITGSHTAGRLVGVGIGMVGPLDHARGVVRDAHRLRHWHDVPLRELAERRIGLPVLLDKDVTAGVTAEAWRRGPAFRDAMLVFVESGVGAGLWLSGTAYRGAHTNAGEFGHMVLSIDGPRCVCGRDGCLEILHDAAVERGDIAGAARVLGVGVVNVLQAVDVNHVVLSGSDLLEHAEIYRAAVAEAVRTQVPRADWLTVEVALSALGVDVVAAGAAMQVLNACYGVRMPAVDVSGQFLAGMSTVD
jgi:predicted NBD/HSP70 family sugar kinase